MQRQFSSVSLLPSGYILLPLCLLAAIGTDSTAMDFEDDIRPFLEKHCLRCHTGDDSSGDTNLDRIRTPQEIDENFETWEKAAELVLAARMPPGDEMQPSETERALLVQWYEARFVQNVQAKSGIFRPRRLSAAEYRNTLRSLLGFDLEVAIIEAEQTRSEKSLVLKILQPDVPGKSGFRNDTHSAPLTTVLWDQYSMLADRALEEFFTPARLAVAADDFDLVVAEKIVRQFVPKAFRRNVPELAIDKIMANIRASNEPLAATKRELKIALMSPEFMYRGLLFKGTEGQHPVDDFELAERLSYFLWADMPDAELFQAAQAGTLSQSDSLRQQVQRMLGSPKSVSLAEDFAVQWLALDEIDHVSDETPYVMALKEQPLDFIDYLIREDRPLVEIIDSQVTFANAFTKKFYAMDGKRLQAVPRQKGIEVAAAPNQKLILENTPERGGLLTMPGILAMNRGPILRGTWILERILGESLPDPPANVGQVAENRAGENLTFRQRFEQHRSNASCALCHDKIDPLGFALQVYDDEGGYVLSPTYKPPKRRRDGLSSQTSHVIDASGQLPSGEKFNDFQELKSILTTTQRARVVRNIVNRLLSYALCRKLEYYDQPTVDAIATKMLENNGTYRDLIMEIVNSLPFRETTL
ncbi:MAG: DUF1592 domain-containing protein [Planctomycetales bacterium]|nr:DUF1592 domain-containing protein [Planctomycetales bacterium]